MKTKLTPLEHKFYRAAKAKIPALVPQFTVGRYRADFVVEPAKVAVEIDSYEYHHTRDQLRADAQKTRYLMREGYRVVRFRCDEVNTSLDRCVEELLYELQTEEVTKAPGIIYVDLLFIENVLDSYLQSGSRLLLSKLLDSIVLALDLEVDCDVFLFSTRFKELERKIVFDLVKILEMSRGTLKVYEQLVDFQVQSVANHLKVNALGREVVALVADDPLYQFEFAGEESLVTHLIRRGGSGNMAGFSQARYQTVAAVIERVLGMI